MDEVEARIRSNPLPQRMRARLTHLVPAHVRHFQLVAVSINHTGGEALDPARQDTQAIHVAFFAVFKQQLQPNADAEKRLAGRRIKHGLAQAARVQFAHAVRHRPLPREYNSLGSGNLHGVARDYNGTLRGHVLKCFGHRTQVAHAVIDYRNVSHILPGENTPFI